jgi:hypothetical protein
MPTAAVDVTLTLRMFALYPLSSMSRHRFAVLMAPTIVMKVVRVVSWMQWGISVKEEINNLGDNFDFLISHAQQTWIMVSWVMAALDYTYVCLLKFNEIT